MAAVDDVVPEPTEPVDAFASGIGLRRASAHPDIEARSSGVLILDEKYRLEHPLAVGGMGSVWVATQVTLSRQVAVKFVDVRRRDPLVLERFLREAQLAAAIHHPNVVDIVDFGVAESGEPVIVMELLTGQTLADRLAAPIPLSTHQVVQIMGQVLSALEAVHAAGILHSDMKPENVMLDAGEGDDEHFARLIDFGIAFSTDPTSQLRRGRFGTGEHVVNGTPEYMPPEQAEGRSDLDARVDVYAASVILYEMLTGVSPFAHEHPGAVLHKVIEGAFTPFSMLRPDIPELASVITRGMAHDRRFRPESARELRKLLLAAAEVDRISGLRRSERRVVMPPGAPIEPPRALAKGPTATRRSSVAVVLLAIVALGGGAFAFGAAPPYGDDEPSEVVAPPVLVASPALPVAPVIPPPVLPPPVIPPPVIPPPALTESGRGEPPALEALAPEALPIVAPPPLEARVRSDASMRREARARSAPAVERLEAPAEPASAVPPPAPPSDFVDDPGF